MSVTVLFLMAVLPFDPQAVAGGTIKEISKDGKQVTVSIGSGKTSETFKVTDRTKVLIDDKNAKVTDLTAGQKVTIAYNKTSKQVESIKAASPSASPKPVEKEDARNDENDSAQSLSRSRAIEILRDDKLLDELLCGYCGQYSASSNKRVGTAFTWRLDRVADAYADKAIFRAWFERGIVVQARYKNRNASEAYDEHDKKSEETCGIGLWPLFRLFCDSSLRSSLLHGNLVKALREDAERQAKENEIWKVALEHLNGPASKKSLSPIKYQLSDGKSEEQKGKTSAKKK